MHQRFNTNLFHLPPEIRLRIYEFVVEDLEMIDVNYPSVEDFPQLLAVSRQIRLEFQPVYYMRERLEVGRYSGREASECEQMAYTWFRIFGTEAVPLLRNFSIGFYNDNNCGYIDIDLGKPSDSLKQQCLGDWYPPYALDDCEDIEADGVRVFRRGTVADRTLTCVVGFFKQRLKGSKQPKLTHVEFKLLVGEVHRIDGHPTSLFSYELKVEDVDLAEFWCSIECTADM